MPTKKLLQRPSLWLNPVMQLVMSLILCIFLPYIFHIWAWGLHLAEPEPMHTAMAGICALFLGFWLHRNVGHLPGTRESSGILPAYLISFGAVLVVILFLRIPYSRSILILSFFASNIWFFLVYVMTQRRSHLQLGIVAGGMVDVFDRMDGVETHALALDIWPTQVNAITADFREDHSDEWEARLADYVLSGIPVFHSKTLYESLTGRAEIEHLSENTFGALGPQSSLLLAKTIFDRMVALPTLLLLTPFMLIIGVLIRLDSPGRSLFRQQRVGYRGTLFTVYKFRTMYSDPLHPKGDDGDVERFMTQPNDPRITRLGMWLRRGRIDELPQIINILRGEMSWIGPRPEAAALSAIYQQEIPYYRYRHVVRPGVTGWAQISQGHVTDVEDIRTKLAFDFYYIRNFSAWLDLLIIAKTVKTMLTGFGHR